MRILGLLILLVAAFMLASPALVLRPVADDFNTCEENEIGDEAIAACTRAINSGRYQRHDLANEYKNRGMEYFAKGDHDRAIADYNEAIRLDPKYEDPFANRCASYLLKKDYGRAIADCNEAIQLDPKDAYAYTNRGVAYYAKGDLDRAIADYDQALKLDPNHAPAIKNRAVAITKRGH
jgi:tetratricopeptide (TPR) repeat protein